MNKFLAQDEEAQKIARDKFLVLKRVLRYHKEGIYDDENILTFFAGFCGYVPKEEDLKFEEGKRR